MPDLLSELWQSMSEGLRGNTLTCCSRWAAARRVMGGDFAGPYSTKYHPWAKEIQDSQAPFNYAMKGAQLGVTECGINRALYTIDQLKRDVLYVLPTSLNAADFSKTRFTDALTLSPYLKSIFTDTNTVSLKKAGTNSLYIRGSRGDSNLKSIPVSVLILDEVDEMDPRAINLALERLSGQMSKWVWGISTPKIPNKGIHKLYLSSTQEHYVFECPSCSKWTELVWPDSVEIIGESLYDRRCQESFLKCKECKARLEQRDKPNWLGGTGKWQQFAQNGNPDVRGFYVNQLYSYTVTPGDIVVQYHRGLGDEAAAQEFHNSKLGLPFIGEGAQVTDGEIDDCIKNHTCNEARPKIGGTRLITLGIDQGKWNYWNVDEWFVDQMSCDMNVAARRRVLAFGKFHEDDWAMADQLMREWQILACVIDADPQINEARRFARRFAGYVWLCRYRRGKVGKEISITEEETGAPLATVDRTNWLTASLGRYHTKRVELPRDVTLEYREHMKSLVRTYEKDEMGNFVATFVETGPDHFAHAYNYSEIALPLAASITTGADVEKFL